MVVGMSRFPPGVIHLYEGTGGRWAQPWVSEHPLLLASVFLDMVLLRSKRDLEWDPSSLWILNPLLKATLMGENSSAQFPFRLQNNEPENMCTVNKACLNKALG